VAAKKDKKNSFSPAKNETKLFKWHLPAQRIIFLNYLQLFGKSFTLRLGTCQANLAACRKIENALRFAIRIDANLQPLLRSRCYTPQIIWRANPYQFPFRNFENAHCVLINFPTRTHAYVHMCLFVGKLHFPIRLSPFSPSKQWCQKISWLTCKLSSKLFEMTFRHLELYSKIKRLYHKMEKSYHIIVVKYKEQNF